MKEIRLQLIKAPSYKLEIDVSKKPDRSRQEIELTGLQSRNHYMILQV